MIKSGAAFIFGDEVNDANRFAEMVKEGAIKLNSKVSISSGKTIEDAIGVMLCGVRKGYNISMQNIMLIHSRKMTMRRSHMVLHDNHSPITLRDIINAANSISTVKNMMVLDTINPAAKLVNSMIYNSAACTLILEYDSTLQAPTMFSASFIQSAFCIDIAEIVGNEDNEDFIIEYDYSKPPLFDNSRLMRKTVNICALNVDSANGMRKVNISDDAVLDIKAAVSGLGRAITELTSVVMSVAIYRTLSNSYSVVFSNYKIADTSNVSMEKIGTLIDHIDAGEDSSGITFGQLKEFAKSDYGPVIGLKDAQHCIDFCFDRSNRVPDSHAFACLYDITNVRYATGNGDTINLVTLMHSVAIYDKWVNSNCNDEDDDSAETVAEEVAEDDQQETIEDAEFVVCNEEDSEAVEVDDGADLPQDGESAELS